MNKKYNENKYVALSSLVIAILIFIFILLGNYVVLISALPTYLDLIILFIISLFASILIVFGFTIFSSSIADAMTTLRRMLRIESLSNPLLMKLSTEAPGTYHHSLNVSNLAQKAAKAIKANSLLVRTAAYYHDIGKLENPLLYIENQSDAEIPNDESEKTINQRASDIISHVKNGVTLAESSSLPEEIVDLISEHHGTARATYFYEIAKEKGLKVKKTDFRYSGPKPQTKESIILMLADCVEATARAARALTRERIKNIIDQTVADRLDDKQISFSIITESELSKVKESLADTLNSIYHQRISYKRDEN